MKLLERANNVLTQHVTFKRARSRLTAPVASFTFDDFPRSAWTVGGPLLARHGARGTFYAAGRYCEAQEGGVAFYTADDLRAVHAAGHEVGCHTWSHRHGSRLASDELDADWKRNAIFVTGLLGTETPRSFAYPYGDASPRIKAMASRRFPVSRGIRMGVNSASLDLGQLRAVPLERRNWSAEMVERQVESARRSNGWIVFFSHDVSDDPTPYGATPAMLEHALIQARDAGMAMLPVAEALDLAVGPKA